MRLRCKGQPAQHRYEEAHEWVAAGADFLIYLTDSKVLALAYTAAACSLHRSIEAAATATTTA